MEFNRGDVFLMKHRGVTSAKPHFCLVMNSGDNPSKRVVLTFASSQVDTRLKIAAQHGNPPETVVHVTPEQYTPFTKLTVIDCNFARIVDSSTLESDILAQRAKRFQSFPVEILDRIVRGIHRSNRSTDEMRKLVGPPPALPAPTPGAKPRITVSRRPSQSA